MARKWNISFRYHGQNHSQPRKTDAFELEWLIGKFLEIGHNIVQHQVVVVLAQSSLVVEATFGLIPMEQNDVVERDLTSSAMELDTVRSTS